MERHPIVYLPIEFGPREFDSKALLATVLATRGYGVVIGQQWMLAQNLPRLPAGAVLFKSFNSLHHQAMRIAKSANHAVFTLEEELLSHMDRKLVEMSCSGALFSLPDVIFANSDFECEVLKELSGGNAKIEVTGNGRVDILKPHYRAFFQRDIEAIKARFGDFILVNTNFGVTNTIWDNLEQVTKIQVRAGSLKPDDPQSMAAWEEQIAFEHENKAAIIAAVKELARRRPAQKIVLRPHPGEALERWNGVFADVPNVVVVREGAHVPWTLACRLLLHTSCTTGFEAQIAGKLALSLVPRPNFISDSFISNHLNAVFSTSLEMVDAVEAYLDGGNAPAHGRLNLTEASYYVWNIGEHSGVDRIADLLTGGQMARSRPAKLPPLQHIPLNPKLQAKFNLSLQECADVFHRLLGIVDKSLNVNLAHIGDSLFYLSPAA